VIGNLAQRSLTMIARNCDGRVPEPGAPAEADRALLVDDRLVRVVAVLAERHLAQHEVAQRVGAVDLHEVLAGLPDVGRVGAAEEGVRARLPAQQGREDVEVGRWRGRR
jgi:hypothetical protein